MHCPWKSFQPSKIDFCEENLCQWIVEPASSFSCIFYVLFAIVIYKQSKNQDFIIQLFALASLLIGLFSFIFHATLTFVGSMLDLGSMYLLATTFIFINLTRFERFKNSFSKNGTILYYVVFNLFLLTYTYFFEETTGIFYLGMMMSVLSMEIIHFFNRSKAINYSWIGIGFSCYVIGSFFWYWDTYRVWCDPQNHIFNGHVAWHFFSACAIYSMYRYFSQFFTEKLSDYPLYSTKA